MMVTDAGERNKTQVTSTAPATGLACWRLAGCDAKRAATCAARPSS